MTGGNPTQFKQHADIFETPNEGIPPCGDSGITLTNSLSPEIDPPRASQCKDKLICLYTNADSLTNKIHELESKVSLQNPSIICITETMPKGNKTNITPHELTHLGYSSFHNLNSRGVSVYVKSDINATQVNLEPDFNESIWLVITGAKNHKTLIGCVYRSPSSTQENNVKLLQLLDNANLLNFDTILITGDFNYKEIDWKVNKVNCGPSHPAHMIHDKINDLFLTQMIHEPTRYREGETPNCLDWIITNNPHLIDDVEIGPPLGEKGDHCTITFTTYAKLENYDMGGNYCFKRGDFDKMRENVKTINWTVLLQDKEVEEAWNTFQNIMNRLIESNVPKSKPKSNKSPPWFNKEIRTKIKNKNKAWSNYRKHKSTEAWENFTQTRNSTNRAIITHKREFETDLAHNIKNNPKMFWNYVKSLTGGQKDIPPITDSHGNTIKSDKEKAELFNNYFCEVYTKEDLTYTPRITPRSTPHLEKCSITLDKVRLQINNLNVSKAAGPDNIHARVIFELKEHIALPLFLIFVKSLDEEKLPKQWKMANIKPIFKKGNKHMTSNYRPVSLTAVCCKILERIIRADLMNFLESNNILSTNQHGFRSGRSCCTQLLEIMEIWTRYMDSGKVWDCVYLDFAKAFDKVPHKRLKIKLQAVGITSKILGWISNFLDDRYQAVVIKGNKSTCKKVTSGIPQGSVLGPILFVVFINDLPDEVSSYIKIFADDTKIFRIIADINDSADLQADLNTLFEWSRKWQLEFNTSKCTVMHYGSRNIGYEYHLNGLPISESNREKDLGVNFDTSLKFSEHIGIITAKSNSRLGIIKRTFTEITPNIFLPLYKALVRPILEYCSVIWQPMLMKDKIEIEKVQRRATKLVKGISHLDYNERLIALNLDSLHFRRRRTDIIQVFRIIKGIDKIPSDLFFTYHREDRTRGHNLKLFKSSVNNNTRLNSFSQRIINDWNGLNESTVNSDTVNAFKTALKKEWKHHPDRYDMP